MMNLLTDNIPRTEGQILFDGMDILKLGKGDDFCQGKICLSAIILHRDEPELLTVEGHLEIINVELIEWQSDGFKAVVVDTGNSNIFPVGAELSVIFREYNTEIVLGNGTSYGYGEIQTSNIEWPVDSVIEVSFGVYEKYDANRGYENKVYAYRVELVPQ